MIGHGVIDNRSCGKSIIGHGIISSPSVGGAASGGSFFEKKNLVFEEAPHPLAALPPARRFSDNIFLKNQLSIRWRRCLRRVIFLKNESSL